MTYALFFKLAYKLHHPRRVQLTELAAMRYAIYVMVKGSWKFDCYIRAKSRDAAMRIAMAQTHLPVRVA